MDLLTVNSERARHGLPELHLRIQWRRIGTMIAAPFIVGFGHLIGYARKCLPALPGLCGAALVSFGVSGYDWRAGWIAGGLFLLAIDRQTSFSPPWRRE